MGHGDETNYVYLFKSSALPSVLEHLVASLDNSGYKIDHADVDRTATINFDGNQYSLPIYAISNNHFSSGDAAGFRSESDLQETLTAGGEPICFDSGVWCKPENILDEDEAERTASKGKKTFRLTHIEIQLDVAAKYARLRLSIWGGMYWGGTESDPSFAKLVKPLNKLSEAWIVEDETGSCCNKPKLDDAKQERFCECYQDNDCFADEDATNSPKPSNASHKGQALQHHAPPRTGNVLPGFAHHAPPRTGNVQPGFAKPSARFLQEATDNSQLPRLLSDLSASEAK